MPRTPTRSSASLAEQSIAALGRALPRIAADPGDRDARSDAQYGAFLAGACLGSVGMALHHKLCHTLGGMFDLPHAETHTVVLPHALAYNAPAVPQAVAAMARALGVDDAPRGFSILPARSARRARCARSACRKAASTRPPTWRSPIRTGIRGRSSGQPIRELIARAWAGEEPA